MVAEIRPEFAVAVIERSLPHFHLKTREVYRVLRGGLCVARAGQGHVLQKGQTIAIEPRSNPFCQSSRGTGLDRSGIGAAVVCDRSLRSVKRRTKPRRTRQWGPTKGPGLCNTLADRGL
jgi:hypothetical protein